MSESCNKIGIMQKSDDSQSTQEAEHSSLAAPDETKHPLCRLEAPMHLLLGCLLTPLFEARPSLTGDKCHLPPSLPHPPRCLVADRCLVFMNILCTARPHHCRRSFDLHFKRKYCLCHCQRLCVTRSAFAVVTCLFECSNRTATQSSSRVDILRCECCTSNQDVEW